VPTDIGNQPPRRSSSNWTLGKWRRSPPKRRVIGIDKRGGQPTIGGNAIESQRRHQHGAGSPRCRRRRPDFRGAKQTTAKRCRPSTASWRRHIRIGPGFVARRRTRFARAGTIPICSLAGLSERKHTRDQDCDAMYGGGAASATMRDQPPQTRRHFVRIGLSAASDGEDQARPDEVIEHERRQTRRTRRGPRSPTRRHGPLSAIRAHSAAGQREVGNPRAHHGKRNDGADQAKRAASRGLKRADDRRRPASIHRAAQAR